MDVAVADQLQNLLALRFVLLHHQQFAHAALERTLDTQKRLAEDLLAAGFFQMGRGAEREALAPVFVDRDDVDGNVPYLGVVLEAIEHRQAGGVGAADVERARRGWRLAPCSRFRGRGRAGCARRWSRPPRSAASGRPA